MNNSFPTYDYFMSNIIHPTERSRKNMNLRYRYYSTKHSISKLLNPKKIAEFGVRYGYSGYAICSGSSSIELYHGYDKAGLEGGVKDSKAHTYAKSLISPYAPVCNIYNTTTEKLVGKPMPLYDFVHVDAGHKYNDVIRDLELAFNCSTNNGYILIDDFDAIKDVKKATKEFLIKKRSSIESSLYFDGLKGELLIKLNKG